jgi:Lrp/AsnC family transcriptional regulator, regulator for asnA, asnC and gidA
VDKIDDLDLKIIKELQKDGRASFRDIAEAMKVSEGTVYNRINKLIESKIIKRFVPDIDYSKIGYDLTVIIGVITEGGKLVDIERRITESPNVNAVYDVTGDYDAIIVAQFKTREELNTFVKGLLVLPGIKRTNTMLVLNTMKEEHGVWL